MKLYVPLRRDEVDRLTQLAIAERRRLQDQAAILIAEGLDRAGTPPAPDPDALTDGPEPAA